MLRHVVLFRFTDDTTAEDVEAIRTGLASLPGQIPEIRSYEHGKDARVGENTWDYAIVAEFDDAAAWEVYDTHPAHDKVRADLVKPHLAERATVRFET
jgi:hypothetical protein